MRHDRLEATRDVGKLPLASIVESRPSDANRGVRGSWLRDRGADHLGEHLRNRVRHSELGVEARREQRPLAHQHGVAVATREDEALSDELATLSAKLSEKQSKLAARRQTAAAAARRRRSIHTSLTSASRT